MPSAMSSASIAACQRKVEPWLTCRPFTCSPASPSRPIDSTTTATRISISVIPRWLMRRARFDGGSIIVSALQENALLGTRRDRGAAVIERLPRRIVLGNTYTAGNRDRDHPRRAGRRTTALAYLKLSRRDGLAASVVQQAPCCVEPELVGEGSGGRARCGQRVRGRQRAAGTQCDFGWGR